MTIEKIADDVIKAELKDKAGDVNEYFGIITTPERKTADAEELNSILNIAVKIQDGKIKLDKNDKKLAIEIKEHIKKFGWINTRGFYGNEWTVDEIFKRFKDMLNEDCKKRLNELNKNHEPIKNKTDKILREINADKDFRKLVSITKEYAAYRTDRMDAFIKSGFIARPLFRELAKRMNLELDDFFNLTVEEIEDIFLHGKDYSMEVSERRKGFGFIFYKDSVRVLTGKELEEYKQKEGKEEVKDVKELKGTVANKGFATGIVKVLFKKTDMVKVRKGDILVISMTTPDFVPAMERAAAFVTDEGGILCHAAIVSREMNKPCIIGTKIATKVFKDGDLVEVDAEKGVVRIVGK